MPSVIKPILIVLIILPSCLYAPLMQLTHVHYVNVCGRFVFWFNNVYNIHNIVCILLSGRLTKLMKWQAKRCFLLGHCTCSLFVNGQWLTVILFTGS